MTNTILSTIQRYTGAINYAAFMGLIFLLPFPWHFVQIAAIVWLITWALEGRWLQKGNYTFRQSLIPILLIIAFIAYETVSLLWTRDMAQGISEISKHLPLLAFCLIAICGVNRHYHPEKLKTCLMVGSLMSMIAYLLIIYWYRQSTLMGRVDPKYWWVMLGEGPIDLIKHRFYYCLVLISAIAFSPDVYTYYKHRYAPWTAALTVGLTDLLLLFGVFLTGSRTMMVVLLFVLLVFFLIRYTGKYRRWIAASIGSIAITCIGLLLLLHPRFQVLRYDPRIYIWQTIIHHADEYGAFGMGIGSSDAFLLSCYEADNNRLYQQNQYGAHNQYLTLWMELGPIAVLLLWSIMGLSVWLLRGAAKRDALLLSLIVGLGLITETALTRMSGLYILISLMMIIVAEQRDTDSRQPARL